MKGESLGQYWAALETGDRRISQHYIFFSFQMEMQFLMQQAWWFPGLREQQSCCGPGSGPRAGCDGQWATGVAVPHQPWPGAALLSSSPRLLPQHLHFPCCFCSNMLSQAIKLGQWVDHLWWILKTWNVSLWDESLCVCKNSALKKQSKLILIHPFTCWSHVVSTTSKELLMALEKAD